MEHDQMFIVEEFQIENQLIVVDGNVGEYIPINIGVYQVYLN